MPEEPGVELENLQKYRRQQGGANLLEEYAVLEVMVISKKHKRSLVDLDDAEREGLAEVLAEVTRRYDNLFETHFPYSKLVASVG